MIINSFWHIFVICNFGQNLLLMRNFQVKITEAPLIGLNWNKLNTNFIFRQIVWIMSSFFSIGLFVGTTNMGIWAKILVSLGYFMLTLVMLVLLKEICFTVDDLNNSRRNLRSHLIIFWKIVFKAFQYLQSEEIRLRNIQVWELT